MSDEERERERMMTGQTIFGCVLIVVVGCAILFAIQLLRSIF